MIAPIGEENLIIDCYNSLKYLAPSITLNDVNMLLSNKITSLNFYSHLTINNLKKQKEFLKNFFKNK